MNPIAATARLIGPDVLRVSFSQPLPIGAGALMLRSLAIALPIAALVAATIVGLTLFYDRRPAPKKAP